MTWFEMNENIQSLYFTKESYHPCTDVVCYNVDLAAKVEQCDSKFIVLIPPFPFILSVCSSNIHLFRKKKIHVTPQVVIWENFYHAYAFVIFKKHTCLICRVAE